MRSQFQYCLCTGQPRYGMGVSVIYRKWSTLAHFQVHYWEVKSVCFSGKSTVIPQLHLIRPNRVFTPFQIVYNGVFTFFFGECFECPDNGPKKKKKIH